MIDRVGPIVTAATGTFVLAGQVIDEVNTTAETVAVILFAGGVFLGALRAMRSALRFAAKANDVLGMLEHLDERLTDGDRRMQRIETRLDAVTGPMSPDA